jgi:hypothetical protein
MIMKVMNLLIIQSFSNYHKSKLFGLCLSLYQSLWNAAFLVCAVIIKLTKGWRERERDQRSGIGEEGTGREGLTGFVLALKNCFHGVTCNTVTDFFPNWDFADFFNLSLREEQRSCDGRRGGTRRPSFSVLMNLKKGA